MASTDVEDVEGVTATEWARVPGDPFVAWWLRHAQAVERERERKAQAEADARTAEQER